ncbi:flagellar hook-basal body complex protein FliE [Rhodoblastus acidophilus]|uniref:Flagellar hook-basal body complex protein FliE n=1 Tax=Candidatus Rhodoblastus alkanivorans TaxID=2954117 RepID=A0ABS9Z3G7_9HYPH|nr:flagellar hook-basal body complex protein FliE [Candidatus Rhodoblastus alkanivorans]MCI4678822.1 flagellar hook-basal body complex protein FliE [Candidatus Rhodoblastus alkanivorans]MCI4682211.1 flagellar hook-basal body complex protein FliE [Candidatus Rhodoblastus alkanivorans]MDI4639513.1 flagellar hook-basal body complex protein FliE [Rhodoblastus acidophilus]
MIAAILPLAAGAVQTAASVAPAAVASVASAGSDFGAALAQAADNALHTLKTAETTSIKGIEGKASVQQVVDSMMSAERTLQTTLAIRDKTVAAFQQISQMQI